MPGLVARAQVEQRPPVARGLLAEPPVVRERTGQGLAEPLPALPRRALLLERALAVQLGPPQVLRAAVELQPELSWDSTWQLLVWLPRGWPTQERRQSQRRVSALAKCELPGGLD
ncbi:hypothetical protein HYPDE_28453 [Hyphomicrobium denitrificans 1NES1]|uniref:Uncharacterized protein n=1 Tax=Hyphomicrobium denitrificans 1NES1 TaxID=670307 RepID=N0BB71_9HYPH|nr:hypothetical protein HYPDE_28453 [Hyphomicrobium denitrificans 1NES1]